MGSMDAESQVAMLTDVLVYLAQCNDLSVTKITKATLPDGDKQAIVDWLKTFNSDVPTFENSVGDDVIHAKYSDEERGFYVLQFGFFDLDKIEGWIITQEGGVIGQSVTSS